ncbi:unnamed protein product, partial [Iphiclides podalirius]
MPESNPIAQGLTLCPDPTTSHNVVAVPCPFLNPDYKVEILMEYPFHMEKQDDGVHFKLESGDTQYTFNVLEKASFDADNLLVGGKESSKEIINFMNNEWKLILETFGKTFFDKAIEYLQIYFNKFFDGVAAQHFINEDLSSYVKQ